MDGEMKNLVTHLKEMNAAFTLEIEYIEQSIEIGNADTRATKVSEHAQNILMFADQARDITQKIVEHVADSADVDNGDSTKYPQELDVTNGELECVEEICSSDDAELLNLKIDLLTSEQAAADGCSANDPANDSSANNDDTVALDLLEVVYSADQTNEEPNANSSSATEHDDGNNANANEVPRDHDYSASHDPSENQEDDNDINDNNAPINIEFDSSMANSSLPRCYKRNARRLVMEAIVQMEGSVNQNANDHLIDLQNLPVLRPGIILDDIQPHLKLATGGKLKNDGDGGDAPLTKQRKRRILPHVQEFLKRRRSMDMRKISLPVEHASERALQETSIPIKKRAPARRKTICGKPPAVEAPTMAKNTDQNAHVASDLWTKLCKFCDRKIRSLQHYVDEHGEHEVPIARPPPHFARLIRKKAQQSQFSFDMKKRIITGNCPVCDKSKTSSKGDWAKHILTHTGEKKFICLQCNGKMDNVYQHCNKCPGKPVNASLSNSKVGIAGFMCNDCNYLQINEENLVKHLKNEHGYMRPELGANYGKFNLIPSVFG